jgi:hypothetical protein
VKSLRRRDNKKTKFKALWKQTTKCRHSENNGYLVLKIRTKFVPTYRHGYGYASLLFLALYGEYLSSSHNATDVAIKAPAILSHTSNLSTVINLNSDVSRTGFRIT